MTVEGVEHFRKVITRWDAEHVDDESDLDDLCIFLVNLDLLKGDLTAYRSRLEQEVARRMKGKLHEFPGGTAEYKGGTKRTHWDTPLLAGKVVTEAMEQGEHPQEALVACAGIGYWRTGELRKRGIDPDQFSESERGLPHVVFRTNEEEK